jgi:hypothetical protein
MPGLASIVRAAIAVGLVAVGAACTTAGPAHESPASELTRKAPAARVVHKAAGIWSRCKAAAAGPARIVPAASYPGVYLGNMAGPWSGPSVRPRTLDLGADWSVNCLRWNHWGPHGASGHGIYGECADAGGPCDYYWAAITVTRVRMHRGARYFATMKITGRHQHTEWLAMNTKLGWWQPR